MEEESENWLFEKSIENMIKIWTLENECNSINKLHELQTPFSLFLLSYYSRIEWRIYIHAKFWTSLKWI